jgi:hypothetical protein
MEKRVPVMENVEFAIRLDERLKVLIEIRSMLDEKKRLVRGLKEAVVDLDTRIERTHNALCRVRPRPESSSSIRKSDGYSRAVHLIQQSRQR